MKTATIIMSSDIDNTKLIEKFDEACNRLENLGYKVRGNIEIKNNEIYDAKNIGIKLLAETLNAMSNCDAIYIVGNFYTDENVLALYTIAKKAGLTIFKEANKEIENFF